MYIAINDKNKFKVRFNPVFIKVSLYMFLLYGIFNFYRLMMGVQVVTYGVFLFITFPTVLLSFVFHRTVVEMNAEDLIISRYYLMRRKIKKFPIETVRSFYLRQNKYFDFFETTTLYVHVENQEFPIVTGLDSLKESLDEKALNEFNQRIQPMNENYIS